MKRHKARQKVQHAASRPHKRTKGRSSQKIGYWQSLDMTPPTEVREEMSEKVGGPVQ